MKRRTFVATGLAATATLLLPAARASQSLAKTPRDTEGPFYPVAPRDNDTNDLLGAMTEPRGDILRLNGLLSDTGGAPVPGAIIDIWQTDPDGRYNHPGDDRGNTLFEDFAYWGKATTASDGRFTFRTYIPGAYRPRPSHIHYIVWQNGRRALTSQIYFRASRGVQTADLRPDGPGRFVTDYRIVI